MGSFSIWHWLVVLAVILVLFGGGNKISGLMGDFAKGIKAFKKGMKEEDGVAHTGGGKLFCLPEGRDCSRTCVSGHDHSSDFGALRGLEVRPQRDAETLKMTSQPRNIAPNALGTEEQCWCRQCFDAWRVSHGPPSIVAVKLQSIR